MSAEQTATDHYASLAHQVSSGAALFRDADGRVLLVKPTYKQDGWLLPGGSTEAGESPLATARREIKEELGLELTADCPLLVIDWVPATGERPAICVFVFDGGVLDAGATDRIRLPREELAAWRFVSLGELADLLPAHRQRRIEACLKALAVGHPIYTDPDHNSQSRVPCRAAEDELQLLDRLRSIAQLGLNYSSDPYDVERYEELLRLASADYERLTGLPADAIGERFRQEVGHITPKVGVEGAVFSPDGNRLLLIRRSDYGDWALPAGWAEVGESLEEAVVREVEEETGVTVRAEQVISVCTYPPSRRTPHARCAVVYHCTAIAGQPHPTDEALESGFLAPGEVDAWCEHAEATVREALVWRRQHR